jgi:hypothetical protein
MFVLYVLTIIGGSLLNLIIVPCLLVEFRRFVKIFVVLAVFFALIGSLIFYSKGKLVSRKIERGLIKRGVGLIWFMHDLFTQLVSKGLLLRGWLLRGLDQG